MHAVANHVPRGALWDGATWPARRLFPGGCARVQADRRNRHRLFASMRSTLYCSSLLFWLPLFAAAQPSPSPAALQAYRLPPDAQVVLDGRLDEPFWPLADSSAHFTQQQPREGSAATERTVVRVAFDEAYLYVGAVLYDTRPDRIKAYQRRRDARLGTDDRFRWVLDTFEDGRSAYFFETNPAGLRTDGIVTIGQGTNVDLNWDGIWDVRTHRGAEGWSVEARIPVRSLDFDPGRSTWGINFQRTIRRKNEEVLWTSFRRDQGLFRVQDAGRLAGLEGMSQGIGLEVAPYGMTSRDHTWGTTTRVDVRRSFGVDATYSLTPNLRTSITVNTDFAEAEVDQRRVNLTRFPLFFPEKRTFFLESARFFGFAPSSGVTPFFSRRIGLVAGEAIPIRVGARAAGQVGRLEVGALHVRTAAREGVPAEGFSVARFRANVGTESTAGIIYTRRATHGGDPGLHDRHTYGADVELGTSSFRSDDILQFQAFFVGHNAPRQTDETDFFDRTARGIRINYPNRPVYGHTSYREFGSAFEPAVGFTPRNGFRRLQPSVGVAWQLGASELLQEVAFSLRHEYLMDLDFRPLDVNTRLRFLDLEFESGEQVRASVRRDFERLTEDFDILRDGRIVVPAGRYTGWTEAFSASTASHRRIAGEVGLARRTFWSGHREDLETELTVRPYPGINVSATWEHRRARLEEGAFDTNVFRTEANLDLHPQVALLAQVQYDDLSELLGLFTRFRWIIRPGSDLFVVYTHNWLNDTNRLSPISSEASTKLTYTHRF